MKIISRVDELGLTAINAWKKIMLKKPAVKSKVGIKNMSHEEKVEYFFEILCVTSLYIFGALSGILIILVALILR